MSFQRKEDWLVHFQISSQSFSLPLVIPSLSKSFYIACLSPRLTEQGWSKFLRLSRDAPEIYPVLLASCAGLTFAVCIMGHNLFVRASTTQLSPVNIPVFFLSTFGLSDLIGIAMTHSIRHAAGQRRREPDAPRPVQCSPLRDGFHRRTRRLCRAHAALPSQPAPPSGRGQGPRCARPVHSNPFI